MKVDIQDELNFWIGGNGNVGQIPEHALFLGLGLEQPAKLKADAMKLFTVLDELKKTGPAKKPEAVVKATLDLRALETEILELQANGKWTGWLFPTFIDHLRREGDYFLDRIGGRLTGRAAQEVCSYSRFLQEHAAFAAHLLDPTEAALIKKALANADAFAKVGEGCGKGVTQGLLTLSERAGKDLDTYWSGIRPTTKSVIHPLLAAHVIREGRRFLTVIDRVKVEAVQSQIANLGSLKRR